MHGHVADLPLERLPEPEPAHERADPTGSTGARDEQRRFGRYAAAVGAASTVVFWWFLTLGRGGVLRGGPFAEVFDIQARALLDGRLSVPDGSLGFEGFVVDGETHAYFGLFPSLLRLPVLALTDRFDGRLTPLSMLLAYVVALWAAARLLARVRALVRPDVAPTATGTALATILFVAIAAGSNLLFLASGAWVYHEASLWGAAAVLAAFVAALDLRARPRLRTVAVAGAWTAVAWLSRGSVGLAPTIVLGLLGLAHLTDHRWSRVLVPGPVPRPPRPRVRTAAALFGAALVGAVAFGAVNTARFGSPTVLPMDKQVASANPWPSRAAALEEYDGSLFSARLVPSVLFQSLRPDLLEPSTTWPFLELSGKRPPTWGGVVWDTVEPSAGLTVTSPLLLVLGAVGLVAVVRPRRPPEGPGPGAAALRPFVLGGLAATWGPLTIAFIAQRYMTDALPLLVVTAAAGAAVTEGWVARRGRRTLVTWGASALCLAGVAVTVAVTWSFQRFHIPPDPEARAAGLRAQVAVSDVVGDPPAVHRYDELPPDVAAGTLAVVGPCDALYLTQDDGGVQPIEVTATGGHHRIGMLLPRRTSGGAIVTIGGPDDHLVLALDAGRDGHALVLLRNGREVARSDRFAGRASWQEIEIWADPVRDWVTVLLDGREVLHATGAAPQDTTARLGTDAFGPLPLLDARLVDRPFPTPTCDALVEADR